MESRPSLRRSCWTVSSSPVGTVGTAGEHCPCGGDAAPASRLVARDSTRYCDEDLDCPDDRQPRRPRPRAREPLRVVESVVPARNNRRSRPVSGRRRPYADHWKEFPRSWPAGRAVGPEALKAALAALPDPWRRVVILRDVDGRTPAEVSAATGLTAEQQRDVLNRARELLREKLGHALGQDRGGS